MKRQFYVPSWKFCDPWRPGVRNLCRSGEGNFMCVDLELNYTFPQEFKFALSLKGLPCIGIRSFTKFGLRRFNPFLSISVRRPRYFNLSVYIGLYPVFRSSFRLLRQCLAYFPYFEKIESAYEITLLSVCEHLCIPLLTFERLNQSLLNLVRISRHLCPSQRPN
jgi:hypothetical protein